MVKVTITCGRECSRGSTSVVRHARPTRSRKRLAYQPNCMPNGELVPRLTPPPPGMEIMGETTAWPLGLYNWFGRSCCFSRNLFRADAASDGRFSALRLFKGIASGSGAFTCGLGLGLGGGSG